MTSRTAIRNIILCALVISIFVFSGIIHAAITTDDNFSVSDPVTYSSVTWADVNGDGYADMLGAVDDMNDVNGNAIRGRVYCFNVRNNTTMWNFIPIHDDPPNYRPVVISTPTVADLDGQPGVEIIFSVGFSQTTNPGALFILDRFGNEIFYYDNFQDMNADGVPDGNYATAAVGDLNRDGTNDFVLTSLDQHIYAFGYNSRFSVYQKFWDFHCGDTLYSSPALANIDSDPYLEIIVGIPVHIEVDTINTDFDFDIEYDGGMIVVLNHDGTIHSDFRHMTTNPHKPKTYTTQTIRSSPAVADIDNDGYFEIIHATSAFRSGFHGRCGPSSITPIPQPYVYAWNHNGTRAWNTWPSLGAAPADACDSSIINDSESSPAIGDINQDGILDVVVGQRSANGTARVFVFRGTDGASISPYPMLLTDRNGATPTVGIRSNPVIANIDSDSQQEILLGILNNVMILDRFGYSTGNHVCLNNGGTADCIDVGAQIVYQSMGVWNGDTDQNSELGIGYRLGTGASTTGRFTVWDSGQPVSGLPPGSWPMFRQNSYHTGLYDVVAPGQITDLTATQVSGQTVQLDWTAPGHNGYTGCAFSYEIRYTADTPFNWNSATIIDHQLLPSVSGTHESLIVDLPVASSYQFALVARDEAENTSTMSNVADLNVNVPGLGFYSILFLLILLTIFLKHKLTFVVE